MTEAEQERGRRKNPSKTKLQAKLQPQPDSTEGIWGVDYASKLISLEFCGISYSHTSHLAPGLRELRRGKG